MTYILLSMFIYLYAYIVIHIIFPSQFSFLFLFWHFNYTGISYYLASPLALFIVYTSSVCLSHWAISTAIPSGPFYLSSAISSKLLSSSSELFISTIIFFRSNRISICFLLIIPIFLFRIPLSLIRSTLHWILFTTLTCFLIFLVSGSSFSLIPIYVVFIWEWLLSLVYSCIR